MDPATKKQPHLYDFVVFSVNNFKLIFMVLESDVE
jgi:hypothetical protein